VRIELHVNGSRYRVAKLGPDRLYLVEPLERPVEQGEVVLQIDGHERRWRVALAPNGSRVIAAHFEER